jgi:hypothetical protein
VACFISRRFSPLQRRPHKICQMSGPMDPTQHSTHELTPADILRRIKDIGKSSQATFAWGLEPYSRDRPAPTVNPYRRHISSCPAYRYLGRHISIRRHLSCLIRHTCCTGIFLVSDPLSLPYAEVQLPEDGELPDQDCGRPHCCGR